MGKTVRKAARSAPVVQYSAGIETKTGAQVRYLKAIKSFPVTFGVGPAGTGKTYVAAAYGAELLAQGKVERMILTRPAVEAGEEMGFLPGVLEEKYAPYLAPVRAILEKRLGKGAVEYMLKAKRIMPMPLAYMRGETFDDAFVLLDEAQNTTPTQIKMFLTRIGQNTTVVVDGDMEQTDIKGTSGLADAIQRLSHLPSVRVIQFQDADIVRSGIVGDIIRAYRAPLRGTA